MLTRFQFGLVMGQLLVALDWWVYGPRSMSDIVGTAILLAFIMFVINTAFPDKPQNEETAERPARLPPPTVKGRMIRRRSN